MSANSGRPARKRSRSTLDVLMPADPALDLARDRSAQDELGRALAEGRIVRRRLGLPARHRDDEAVGDGDRPKDLALAGAEQRGGELRLDVVEVGGKRTQLRA